MKTSLPCRWLTPGNHSSGRLSMFPPEYRRTPATTWSGPSNGPLGNRSSAQRARVSEILVPEGLNQSLDYEAELAVVIGKKGRFIRP